MTTDEIKVENEILITDKDIEDIAKSLKVSKEIAKEFIIIEKETMTNFIVNMRNKALLLKETKFPYPLFEFANVTALGNLLAYRVKYGVEMGLFKKENISKLFDDLKEDCIKELEENDDRKRRAGKDTTRVAM